MFLTTSAARAKTRIDCVFRYWPLLFFTLFILMMANSSYATVVYWPDLCQQGTLQITNRNAEPVYVWLQKFNPELESEIPFEIDAHSTLNILTTRDNKNERTSLLHFAETSRLRVQYTCGGRKFSSSLIDGGTVRYNGKQAGETKLILQNLSRQKNKIKIKYYSKTKSFIGEQAHELAENELITFKPTKQEQIDYFEVEGERKHSIFAIDEKTQLKEKSIKPSLLKTANTGIYFLMGPREGTDDTFVVQITNPQLIKEARHLLANPASNEKIVFAKVAFNQDLQFNRNFSLNSKSTWNWTPTEVTGFGDLASTSCNGHPQAVEDKLEFWLQQIGQICFWDYRIKKELSPEEVRSGQINLKKN